MGLPAMIPANVSVIDIVIADLGDSDNDKRLSKAIIDATAGIAGQKVPDVLAQMIRVTFLSATADLAVQDQFNPPTFVFVAADLPNHAEALGPSIRNWRFATAGGGTAVIMIESNTAIKQLPKFDATQLPL